MSKEKNPAKKVVTTEVFQTEACECGAAALSIILKYYGRSVALEEIRYRCGISRDGCSARDIVLAGRQVGLEGHAYKVTLEKLESAPKPAILHWDFRHFVVLECVTKHGAVINDPAKGRRKVTKEELDRNFTGVYITFTPTEGFEKSKGEGRTWDFVKSRLQIDKTSIRYLLISGVLLMIPGLIIPILSNQFIDRIFSTDSSYISMVVICMALMYFYQLIITWIRSFILDRLQLKMSIVSADNLVFRLLRLPMLFYEQRYSGELATRLETDNQANAFLAGQLIEAALDTITAVACLIMMLIYNVPLTAVGVAGAAISVIVTRLMTYRIETLNMKKQQDKSMLSGVLCAGISASESIKACGVENEYAGEILGHYANYTVTEQTLEKAQKKIDNISPAIGATVSTFVLILGSRFAIDGIITMGMLTAFTELLSSFTTPVDRILSFSLQVHGMKAAFARVTDIENAMPDPRFSEEKDREIRELSGDMVLKNVSFGYSPNRPPVVENISFTVRKGSTVGIVGGSGSGKSTLGKLIGGLLTPMSGEIMIDGIPINRIPEEILTSSMSYVGQKSEFFSGTILENITMWKTDFRESDLYQAVMDADVQNIIDSVPEGLHYQLVEGGKNLSGGQRQRVQIARSLMTNPKILVLDEATSALDTITEANVMKAIEKRNCTCVIVAHRLSTIRNCDLILVMDRGSVVEAGTHDQLMARGGMYANLEKER